MDLSKLPKLSQTPPPPPADPPGGADAGTATKVELFCRCGAPIAPGTKFCSNCGASYGEATGGGRPVEPMEGMGAEAWISIAMGALLIYLSPTIWKYYLIPGSFTDTFSDPQGNPMAYRQTEFYWAHLGLAAFSVVLFLEALVMLLARKAPLVMAALVLTLAAALLNVYALARGYKLIGFQVYNALAVAFAIYIAMFQFAVLRGLRSGRW